MVLDGQQPLPLLAILWWPGSSGDRFRLVWSLVPLHLSLPRGIMRLGGHVERCCGSLQWLCSVWMAEPN